MSTDAPEDLCAPEDLRAPEEPLPPHEDPPLPPLLCWRHVAEAPDGDARLERFLAAHYTSPVSHSVAGAAIRLQFHLPAALLRFVHAGQPAWTRLVLARADADEWLGHLSGYELPVAGPASARDPAPGVRRTLMVSLMAVPAARRNRKSGARLIRHFFAAARAAGVEFLAYSFVVGAGDAAPHPLEFSPAAPAHTVACGRAEAVYQVPLYYAELNDRLARFQLTGCRAQPRGIQYLRPLQKLSAAERAAVGARLGADPPSKDSLAPCWRGGAGESLLERLAGAGARAAGVFAFVYERRDRPAGERARALAVLYSAPSDIYCGAGGAEVFAGDQLRAGYLLFLQPLVRAADVGAEERRELARDLLRAAHRCNFDAFFLPAQGLLGDTGGAGGEVVERLGAGGDPCEFPVRRSCDQRYYWTRIGAPAPTDADARRHPRELYAYTC